MNSTRLTYKRSRKTLWLGLAGTLVVIIGSLWLGYAQVQKKEAEVMNPTKPVPSDAELRRKLTKDQYHVTREGRHRDGVSQRLLGQSCARNLCRYHHGRTALQFT